ncbi:cytosolic factor, phosphatidylinositol/phosphatidylcholine transfer protein [Gaertneriomyces sp. JEL0708]|nr:cytosolic factor, phosphatidylinositol/phosphatidylcholine transfer protein [Gaertneriomyces sp. JEL0708]
MADKKVDLNNLTPEQESAAVSELRELLGDQGSRYDDRTLLRFLIARQLNAQKAKEMLEGYSAWREKDGIDKLPLPGINGNPVMQNVRGFQSVPDSNWDLNAPDMPEEFKVFGPYMGGGCFHKVDKEGFPIFIERTGYHDVKGLAQKCPPNVMLDWHVRNNEFVINVIMPECEKRLGKPVEKHCVIFDCTGLGIWQFDMAGLNLLKAVSDLDSKVYPERLGKLFIVNAPGIFARAWKIISRWLDKRILEKIFICGADYKDVLLQHIDASNLPDFLGGTCTCSHMPGGCVPSAYLDRKRAAGADDDFQHNATIGSAGHTYEIEVPDDETGQNLKLNLKFRSTKKAVHFEIKHRKSSGEERVIKEFETHDSHKEVVRQDLPAEPGTYVLSWQKPSGGMSFFNSVSLDYSVDVDTVNGVDIVTEHVVVRPVGESASDSDGSQGDSSPVDDKMANLSV